jgi:hypothetical protein
LQQLVFTCRFGKMINGSSFFRALVLLCLSSILLNAQVKKELRSELKSYKKWDALQQTYTLSAAEFKDNQLLTRKQKLKLFKKHEYTYNLELTAKLPVSLTEPLNQIYALELIDRYPKPAVLIKEENGLIFYRNPGSSKIREIESDKVYSYRNALGSERIIYKVDTLENNWLDQVEMADYMKGQRDAQRYYRLTPFLTAAGGLLVGAASSNIGLYWGPMCIVAYTGIIGYSKPSTGKFSGFNPVMKKNAAYYEGFATAAKKRSTQKAALWSAIGYFSGLAALTAILSK